MDKVKVLEIRISADGDLLGFSNESLEDLQADSKVLKSL